MNEKMFDPKRLADETKELVTVIDEQLGTVRYGHLTVEDLSQLNQVKDPFEKSLLTIYLMLKKAYPDLTIFDVEGFPIEVATRLLDIFNKDQGFPILKESRI